MTAQQGYASQMPRRLLDRCQPDSVLQFRAAAIERYQDGLRLASMGRRTGAIYVWGYVPEMLFKSAYFSLIGVPASQSITWQADLRPAILRGQNMGIAWPNQGAGHNIRAWSELLIAVRALTPATALDPALAIDIRQCTLRVDQLWRETLRYRRNHAYPFELGQVREAVEWLLVQSHLY